MKTIGGVMKVEGIAFGPAARSAARGVARGRTVRNMAIEKRRPKEEIARAVAVLQDKRPGGEGEDGGRVEDWLFWYGKGERLSFAVF